MKQDWCETKGGVVINDHDWSEYVKESEYMRGFVVDLVL